MTSQIPPSDPVQGNSTKVKWIAAGIGILVVLTILWSMRSLIIMALSAVASVAILATLGYLAFVLYKIHGAKQSTEYKPHLLPAGGALAGSVVALVVIKGVGSLILPNYNVHVKTPEEIQQEIAKAEATPVPLKATPPSAERQSSEYSRPQETPQKRTTSDSGKDNAALTRNTAGISKGQEPANASQNHPVAVNRVNRGSDPEPAEDELYPITIPKVSTKTDVKPVEVKPNATISAGSNVAISLNTSTKFMAREGAAHMAVLSSSLAVKVARIGCYQYTIEPYKS